MAKPEYSLSSSSLKCLDNTERVQNRWGDRRTIQKENTYKLQIFIKIKLNEACCYNIQNSKDRWAAKPTFPSWYYRIIVCWPNFGSKKILADSQNIQNNAETKTQPVWFEQICIILCNIMYL